MMLACLTAWTVVAAAAPPSSLVTALSDRHGVEDCRRLAQHTDDLAVDLKQVVDHVTLPPWAPMNAAICLIEEHHSESLSTLRGWVQRPDTRGLARLIFRRIESLPEDTARELLRHALAGPHRDEALVAVQADVRTSIRTLDSTITPKP